MIRVDRNSVQFPPELSDDATSAVAKERKKTATFYDVKSNWDKPYDKYKAYKQSGVVKALNDLFRGKCAYCETNIRATRPPTLSILDPRANTSYITRSARHLNSRGLVTTGLPHVGRISFPPASIATANELRTFPTASLDW